MYDLELIERNPDGILFWGCRLNFFYSLMEDIEVRMVMTRVRGLCTAFDAPDMEVSASGGSAGPLWGWNRLMGISPEIGDVPIDKDNFRARRFAIVVQQPVGLDESK
jgi:hypothetical protein